MTPLSLLVVAAVVGAVSGTHTAIWGMYKDAAHEGFSPARFWRSIVVGATVAVAWHRTLLILPPHAAVRMTSAAGLVLMFGLAYAGERGVVEVWKTFFREEDQAKYTIPMQFNVLGRVVPAGARLLAGTACILVLLACVYGMARLDLVRTGPSRGSVVALLGLAMGLVIACGGAWKDAPTEGFEPLKFLRSPAMTIAFALLLSKLTDSYVETAIAATGYERAVAETYKTFFWPSRPRGKFAGKPVLFPGMLSTREYFVPVFIAIWIAVLSSVVSAIV